MINRLQKLKEIKYNNAHELRNALTPELKAELRALYLHFFGKQLSGCSNCFFDAYIELYRLNPDKTKTQERLFELKRGHVFYVDNKIISFINLTDEYAIKRLAVWPADIKYFNRYPVNWEKLVEEYKQKEENNNQNPGNDSGLSN